MPVATKSTPKKREKFLGSLREAGNVTLAAEAVGVDRSTVYKWRKQDAEFSAQWDDAVEEAADRLEAEARRRAYEGVDEPVFYHGEACGVVRKYSDSLMMFLLRGVRPEKYRENVNLQGSVTLKHGLADRLKKARRAAAEADAE